MSFFTNTLENIARYRNFKRTFTELNALSDKELADIGISRYDICEIAREHAYV